MRYILKTLKLSSTARKQFTVDQIADLMAVDSERVCHSPDMINKAWAGPLTIALVIYFSWDLLGPSVLATIIIIVPVLALNVYAAYQSCKFKVKHHP